MKKDKILGVVLGIIFYTFSLTFFSAYILRQYLLDIYVIFQAYYFLFAILFSLL